MGKPGGGHAPSPPAEYIGRVGQTEGTETSKYLQEQKAIAISQVAASERETSPNQCHVKARRRCGIGVVGPFLAFLLESRRVTNSLVSRTVWKVRP